MGLNIKDIARSDWARVIERSSAYLSLKSDDFTGEIGLIRLNKVRAPLDKQYGGRSVRIIDDGYYWLQIAAADAPYWLTVMFDEQERFIQFYFDISDQNVILDGGKSYFYDLFLDVVMLADGSVYLLDEDELEGALKEGVVTQAQFHKAYRSAEQIMSALKANREPFLQVWRRHFNTLKDRLT